MIRPAGGGPMAFAGLWEHWLGADGSEIETMAILTVPANAVAGRIHDRMPAIIAAGRIRGLARHPARAAPTRPRHCCRPAPDGLLEILEVSLAS